LLVRGGDIVERVNAMNRRAHAAGINKPCQLPKTLSAAVHRR
jgi:hypothetical protein